MDIEEAARDLVGQRGPAALDWLNERIRLLQGIEDMRCLDVTYLLLSEVERMLDRDGRHSSSSARVVRQ